MKSTADHGTLRRSLRPRGPIQLAVSTHRASEATVVAVIGELDVLTARRLMPQLDEIVRRHEGDVAIDLSQAEFIDSFALTILLSTQRRLGRQGRALTVICGTGPVRRAIEFAKLMEPLGVIPSLAEYEPRRTNGQAEPTSQVGSNGGTAPKARARSNGGPQPPPSQVRARSNGGRQPPARTRSRG
jgi:anti-anti-sigma factor